MRPRRTASTAKNAAPAATAYNPSPADALVKQAVAMRSAAAETTTGSDAPPLATIDQLSPVEQAVVALDVDPNALKPIEWLNQAHYDTLKKSNSLGPNLQRRIEAFRHVSSEGQATTA
jgi:hypothetical protein